MVDFESAAHNAIQNVFPAVTILGCNFHFGQALIRKMHAEGLREKYLTRPNIDPDQPRPPDHPVKAWFGSVKALALLPIPLVAFGWQILEHDLHNLLPPALIDQRDLAALQSFAQYFSATWMNGNQFGIEIWNHFANDGPRTTNHAEGYHSALNRNAVPEMHMALRNFLDALQLEHNRVQIRIRKLYAGGEQPKDREPLYARLHQQINNEKVLFTNATGHLWLHNFDAAGLFHFDRQAYQHFVDDIRRYLRLQHYRIGDKIAVH